MIQSEDLNILHLAVYNEHLEVVKLLCESIPDLDLEKAGQIPKSTGLLNDSEMSVNDISQRSSSIFS